jgi:hydroxyacylglutathione hydrolase
VLLKCRSHKGADNVFVGTLVNNLNKISKDKKLLIHCQGGDRAAIACLCKKWIYKATKYSPGMNEWVVKQSSEY